MRLKSIKSVLKRIWQVLIFVRKDRTGAGKFGAFFPQAKDSEQIFDSSCEILIDGKKYLIERHFTGKRDIRQAVFTAAENEAKRKETKMETA